MNSMFASPEGMRPQSAKTLDKAYKLGIEKPGQSFSQSYGNSFRQSVAYNFSHKSMTPEKMNTKHLENTLESINSCLSDYIILSQDTCLYNYTGRNMEGLGKIQGNILGILQHNTVAFTPKGIPLGIVNQQYWSRESEVNFDGKESQKWINSLVEVNKIAKKTHKNIVLVQDREADFVDFFKHERAKNVDLIVRIFQNRNFQIENKDEFLKLQEVEKELEAISYKEITIRRENQEVLLKLELKASKISLFKRKKKELDGFNLVVIKEISATDAKGKDVFDENKSALWYLLTSMPIDTVEQLEMISEFYATRWRIERFHFTMKSGAYNVEKMQFDDIKTMINALAFYSILAIDTLKALYLLREDTQELASKHFTDKEIKLLEHLSKKSIVSAKDFIIELSKKLGAFAPTKKYPFPGVKLIAQVFERFHYIKLGADFG